MVIVVMKSDPKILQAFRWAVGFSGKDQTEIGKILKVSQPSVSLLLGDKREVKAHHLNLIAQAIGMEPEDAIRRSGQWADPESKPPTNNIHTVPRRRAIEFNDRATGERAMKALAEIELLDPGEFQKLCNYIIIHKDHIQSAEAPGPQEKSSAS